MDLTQLLIALVLAVCAVLGAIVGERNGHGARTRLVVGLFLGPLGPLLLAFSRGAGPTAADRDRARLEEQWRWYYEWWYRQQGPPR